jgi:hypothetical protein
VDEHLKSDPKPEAEPEAHSKHYIDPCVVAEEFVKHFQSAHSNASPVVFSTLSESSELSLLTPVSDSLFLRPSSACDNLNLSESMASLGLSSRDVLLYFYTFLSIFLTEAYRNRCLPLYGKQAAILPAHINGTRAPASNYRHMSLSCSFSKVLAFVIHNHTSHHFRLKIGPY